MVRKGAMQIRKQQKRLFSTKVWWGLQASEDKTEVWTHPEQWNILSEALHLFAEGVLGSTAECVEWMRDQGVQRTRAWMRLTLMSPILEGKYYAYKVQNQARKVVQKGGLYTDLDIRESGSQRYLITPTDDPLCFHIQYSPGTAPIPAYVLAECRRKAVGVRGRPARGGVAAYTRLLPTRMVECAVCGASVREWNSRSFTETTTGRNRDLDAYLQCSVLENYRHKHSCSKAQARAMVAKENPHLLIRKSVLSDAVWEMVAQELLKQPQTESPSMDDAGQLQRAERRVQEAQGAFDRFQERCFNGECGDMNDPRIKTGVDRKRVELLTAVEEAEDGLKSLSQGSLKAHNEAMARGNLAEVWAAFLQYGLTDDDKREVLARIVDKVTVHLEEGWFEVQGVVGAAFLDNLRGQLVPAVNENTSSWSFNYTVRGEIPRGA
jgi:hypothetical protein